MNYQLKIINPEIDKRWDEFVFNHPNGSIYNHSLWEKVICKTYGYEPFYIAFENNKTDKFDGIIPLMFVNSKLTGKRVVSLPLTSYCTRMIPECKLIDIVSFVMDHYNSLDYIEFKFIDKIRNDTHNFEEQSLYLTSILNLNIGLDKLFKSFHKNHIQRKIKKAEKNNLKFRVAENEEDLKKFYKLETKVRKKHGLPPQPYSFFKNMWLYLKPENLMCLPLIEYKGKVIAAVVMLKFKDTFYYEYSASDSNYLNLGPNQKIIWEIIQIAHRQGVKYFDFGRSSQDHQSLINFKERWGSKTHKLHYYYYPNVKKMNSRDNNKLLYKLLNFTNRHIPLTLLQLEGKVLYQHLG